MARGIKDNLTGQVFQRLTVIEEAATKGHGSLWLCRCVCGSQCVVSGGNLKKGRAGSCGCLKIDRIRLANTKHGESYTEEYRIYQRILQRCYNKSHVHYDGYGGRGILVAPEWLGEGGYERFVDHIGRRPSKHMTVERKNNNEGYRPGNVVWASRKRQMNNRRTNRIVNLNGERMTLRQAVDLAGLPYHTVRMRLEKGWSEDRALSQPVLVR